MQAGLERCDNFVASSSQVVSDVYRTAELFWLLLTKLTHEMTSLFYSDRSN